MIGDPVEHSLSPVMHNAALRYLGMDKEFVYERRCIKEDNLDMFVQGMRNGQVYGANVTIPHKVRIIPFLDRLTKEAELIGAVNTIYKEKNQLVGHNTDGKGCLDAFRWNDVDIKGKKIMILGAGGSSRAISFVFALQKPKKITILNRTRGNADSLAREVAEKTDAKTESGSIRDVKREARDSDIIINCTPAGMAGKHENHALITSDILEPGQVVMDIVYNPQKTRLLKEAESAGCMALGGMEMLVNQGAGGLVIWTGKKPPVDVMRAALLLKMKQNIALIGFMAAGKTITGRKLAKALRWDFIETDEIITDKAGKSILEIFESDGEEHFRQLESDAIKEIGEVKNKVISCGGGIVLRKENIDELKKIAVVIRLKAAPEEILKRNHGKTDRPLLQSDDKIGRIKELMKKRERYYQQAADFTIDNSDMNHESVIEEILNLIP
ncbi:MAG: shikimate dehydrogenase [Candidatus Woesearchaeota archaeon]